MTRVRIVWWESATCPALQIGGCDHMELIKPPEIHSFSHLSRAASASSQSRQGAERGLYGTGQAGTLLSDVGRWVMAIHPSALLCLHTRCVLKTCSGFIGWKTTGAPQTLQLKALSCCTADRDWNPPAAPPKPLSLSLCLTISHSLSLSLPALSFHSAEMNSIHFPPFNLPSIYTCLHISAHHPHQRATASGSTLDPLEAFFLLYGLYQVHIECIMCIFYCMISVHL